MPLSNNADQKNHCRGLSQSSEGRKKMAAAHFITIPCEPYTAITYKESYVFAIFVPRANDIAYARFEEVRAFCTFL